MPSPGTHLPPAARGEPSRLALSASGGCWLRAGEVWCWSGDPIELAGSASLAASARRIELPPGVLDADGSLRFGCAVLAAGAVQCWGDNSFGQLGAASRAIASEAPLDVLALADATSIAVAAGHACATRRDGSVACWGDNSSGQCGHDREYAPAVRQLVRPERVQGVRGARAVVVSASSSCALGAAETWCWGEVLRASDRAASGSDRTRATPIAPLARARALGLGADCGCALTAAGTVGCFALRPGACNGPDVRAALETRFDGNDVQRIAVGDRGACAAHADGRIDCWSHRPSSAPPGGFAASSVAPPLLPGSGSPVRLRVPAVAGGPCFLDGAVLECRSDRFWDEPASVEPERIRLP